MSSLSVAFSTVLLFITLLSLLIIHIYMRRKLRGIEAFGEPDVAEFQLLTRESVEELIKEDYDRYIENMSALDIYARQATDKNNYKVISAGTATVFSDEQRARVAQAIRDIRDALKAPKAAQAFDVFGIPKKVFEQIPYKIAAVSSDRYENGYPHTRTSSKFGPVIVLTTDFVDGSSAHYLAKTIFHEQVHIYQKLREAEVSAWLISKGFKTFNRRVGHPLTRANPDTDAFNWQDQKGNIWVYQYSSRTPSGISDTIPEQGKLPEHPWEWMAYGLADLVFEKTSLL